MAWRCQNRRTMFGLLASAGLHATLVTALVLLASNRAQDPLGRNAYTIAVVVPPVEVPDPSSGDRRLVADSENLTTVIDDPGGPPRTEERDFNIEKLRSRRDALFPFLTTDLIFLDRMSEQVRGARSAPALPLAVEPKAASSLPPLQLSGRALQQIVDRAWSRRSRWTAFAEIAGLLRTHDADNGQVPAVLRAYLDQNLLQLFCDASTRVPRLWAMLENAADHTDFIDFVRGYTRDHPSSLATTELLFLLDKLAQASRDTLLLLVSIDPGLELTSSDKTDASELATALQTHYRERLAYWRLSSVEDIKAWYNMVRLQILSTIINTTPHGYRAADARFLVGAIHFEQGDTAEAIRSWRAIQPDSGDGYVEEYSRLLDELQWPAGIRPKQIKYVIDSANSHWRTSSLERLRYFGSTCDSY